MTKRAPINWKERYENTLKELEMTKNANRMLATTVQGWLDHHTIALNDAVASDKDIIPDSAVLLWDKIQNQSAGLQSAMARVCDNEG